MDADAILGAFHREGVDTILIGGMNFLLRHQPVLTYDVDLWVRKTDENLMRTIAALRELQAEWGHDDSSWKPVADDSGWLSQQSVYCLTSAAGAIDIFLQVAGLENQFDACWARSRESHTAGGVPYRSLSDRDMLACQLALPESARRQDRVVFLQNLLKETA